MGKVQFWFGWVDDRFDLRCLGDYGLGGSFKGELSFYDFFV